MQGGRNWTDYADEGTEAPRGETTCPEGHRTGKWQREDLSLGLSKPFAWNLALSELKASLEAIWPKGRLWKHTNLSLHILKT